MTAEAMTERLVRVQTKTVEFYSPGQRIKTLLLGVGLAAVGVISAAIIGPAFLQKGVELGAVGVGLYILPGVGMTIAGAAGVVEGITGRANGISEFLQSMAA